MITFINMYVWSTHVMVEQKFFRFSLIVNKILMLNFKHNQLEIKYGCFNNI